MITYHLNKKFFLLLFLILRLIEYNSLFCNTPKKHFFPGWFSSYRAKKAYDQKDFFSAQNFLEKKQIETPNDPLINYNLGTIFYRQKKYENAKNNFTRAATQLFSKNKKQPSTSDLLKKTYFNLGNTLTQNTLFILPENWENSVKWIKSTCKSNEQIEPKILQQAISEISEAIKKYDAALKIKNKKAFPSIDEKTKSNKKIAEEILKKLQKKQQNQQKNDQNRENNSQNDQNGDKNSQNGPKNPENDKNKKDPSEPFDTPPNGGTQDERYQEQQNQKTQSEPNEDKSDKNNKQQNRQKNDQNRENNSQNDQNGDKNSQNGPKNPENDKNRRDRQQQKQRLAQNNFAQKRMNAILNQLEKDETKLQKQLFVRKVKKAQPFSKTKNKYQKPW